MKYCYKMEPILGPVIPLRKVCKITIPKTDEFYTEHIIDTICFYYNITEYKLKSSSRARLCTDARTVAIYLLKKYIPRSTYKGLGEMFGGRDHSTMIYAMAKFNDLYKSDNIFRLDYEKIQQKLDVLFDIGHAA